MDNSKLVILQDVIKNKIEQYNFRDYEIDKSNLELECTKVWVRKTWNTNRAIVLVQYDSNEQFDKFIKKIKSQIGKKVGYLFFLYPLGLQVILYGENILKSKEELEQYTDKVDTQWVILQSLYILDFKQQKFNYKTTWGQYISGKYQDAIKYSLEEFLQKT